MRSFLSDAVHRLMALLFFAAMVSCSAARLSPVDRQVAADPSISSLVQKLSRGCAVHLTNGMNIGVPAGPKRDLKEIKTINIATYNMMNLFGLAGKFQRKFRYDPSNYGKLSRIKAPRPKSNRERQGNRQAILDSEADIMVVQEAESLEVMQEYSKMYLDDLYHPVLVPGNDPRGIQVGVFFKKDLPLKFKLFSNKDIRFPDPTFHDEMTPVYSRDLIVLEVRLLTQEEGSPPLMVVLGSHYKSKRDIEADEEIGQKEDREGFLHRSMQMAVTGKIVSEIETKWGRDTPIIHAADFNTSIRTSPEMKPIFDSGLKDVVDWLPQAPSPDQWITHTTFLKVDGGKRRAEELDGLLGNAALRDAFEGVEIVPYRFPDGTIKPVPQTREDRLRDPSDHRAVRLRLSFQRLLEKLRARL